MTRFPHFRIPKYRRYAPKVLGVVRLNGRDIYLGTFGSPESWEKYDRLIAEWLANGRKLPGSIAPGTVQFLKTVNEVLLAFWRFAEG